MGAHHFDRTLNRRGLKPIKLVYNSSWLNDQLH